MNLTAEETANQLDLSNRVKRAMNELQQKMPAGYEVPEGRSKPWGTGQAVLVAKDVINEPFLVMDFYFNNCLSTKALAFLSVSKTSRRV